LEESGDAAACPAVARRLKGEKTHARLNYTGGYTDSMDCAWAVVCKGPDEAALLRFTAFDTEAGGDFVSLCEKSDKKSDNSTWVNINGYTCNDYARHHDAWCREASEYPSVDGVPATVACPVACCTGQLAQLSAGTPATTTRRSYGAQNGTLWVAFHSDGSGDADGFAAEYWCGPYVAGCTDPIALNYDRAATADDENCTYLEGCTDPVALNYDRAATADGGGCLYPDRLGDGAALLGGLAFADGPPAGWAAGLDPCAGVQCDKVVVRLGVERREADGSSALVRADHHPGAVHVICVAPREV
jgi:hypothetical protein